MKEWKKCGTGLYEEEYLECEKRWVFLLLMCVGGYFGAFTYSIRGGVFCNAQTANFVLMAMALGRADWGQVLYLLIPMSAYFLGAVVSEAIANPIKKLNLIRWDTLFVLLEMVAVVVLALLPERAPYQITQVTINFICSMQYNTFRQARGIPMATTFCTNHLRQVGIAFTKTVKHRDASHLRRLGAHLAMLGVFVAGGVAATVLCRVFLGRALFAALIPLGIVLAGLLHADLTKERGVLTRVPHGH